MLFFSILGVLWINWDYVTGSSQQQPQQVLPPHSYNPYQTPVQYGAYLQQLDAAGAQALPVQHSFTVNHSPYTFIPQPQIFYQPQNNDNPPPPPKFSPERRQHPVDIQQVQHQHLSNQQLSNQQLQEQLNNQQPIQFLSKTPQYSPHQIQRNFQPSQSGIKIVNPPNLTRLPHNNIPIYGKVPQGHPPVQPYISQGEKFKQQTSGKYPPNKPIEEKHYRHQEQKRPVQTPISQPIRKQPQRQDTRRKEEEEKEEEEEEEAREDSEEESDEEYESGEESGSEEEEDPEDGKGAASDLPPEHNRHRYDFDNRNYRPTFEAAKYIFSERDKPQKKPGTKYYEEEVPRYHEEQEIKYAHNKNTKSKLKQEKEPKPARTRFPFYDSEPKFNRYEPTFEPYEPKLQKYEPPKRIKAKRVEITNGKPTYYYYNSNNQKPNNSDTVKKPNKDSNPQATRKKLVKEKWYVLTKET